MVRVRRRRRRRRGTLVLLLHAPCPLLRGGNPLHQHRIFLLPSLLLLLMLFLLVEASHARPAPPIPRALPPAPRQPPVARHPESSEWTVLMGSERPTEGFDPGELSEERENEVMAPMIGMDLPWERTQPSASDGAEVLVHQERTRGKAMGGVSGGNSVIEGGDGTLPIPLYGIMTDEVSSDVDLMLGGDDEVGGGRVTSEELVMWRLTNHDRRKGELEMDEELLSRNRRTPRERKEGRKEAGNKKKEDEEEERTGREGKQGNRKGKRRPRWRERRRQTKEDRRRKERRGGEKGGKVGEKERGGRNRKGGKESNARPQRRRHQGHQLERISQITESVPTKKGKGSRGGAVPKKPPGSRAHGKSPRNRGPGSKPRDGGSSGEEGVSSGAGNLEDGAARSERSANLSHITGTARKIQMVVKNRNLQIDPWGRVSGAEDEDSDYTILQRTSVSTGRLKIQGVATCLFLCMDRCGLLYGSKNFTEECVWNETMDGHVYNIYTSVAYSNEDRALYLALNGAGKPRRVQVLRKDGKGLVLGKLSNYARVLTRTIQPSRLQRLEDKLLMDRQREAVVKAVRSAGIAIPGYANISAGGVRHRIGPQSQEQPAPTSWTNPGFESKTNRSTALTAILTSLGVDPGTIIPDFNLDSVTFADHPLRHHGYHQLCPMPKPDMVTSGSELVGKNGKVLCKKKDPPIGKGKNGGSGGSGVGGSGEGRKKKKDDEKDGKKRRKRKGQAKDVEEKKKKNIGRNNGKRGGGGGGGGGGGSGGGRRGTGGTKVRKVGEKGRLTKGNGNKEKKGGERKSEMNEGRGEGRKGRNGEVKKKNTNNNRRMKERGRERENQRERERERRKKRVRKRLCDVGRRPRKDKECDKRRKRHRRGKDEVHHEHVLHNNTLEEKSKVLEEREMEGEEEATEAPLEWEEEEAGEEENEGMSEEDDAGDGEDKSNQGNEGEDDEEDGEEGADEEEDEEEAAQEEEEEEEEEGEGGDVEEEDEDEEEAEEDEDEEEDEYEEEEEDGGENDGRGINIRRKRTKEGNRGKREVEGEEDSESS